MSFANKNFSQRFTEMGDKTEGVFEQLCDKHSIVYERTGWNRPRLRKFKRLPFIIRMTPDYIMETEKQSYYIECKGTGYVIKIKQETIDAITYYNGILPVLYFVYNSVENGYAFLTQEELLSTVLEHGVKKRFESDNKEYYELPRSAILFTKEFPKWLNEQQ